MTPDAGRGWLRWFLCLTVFIAAVLALQTSQAFDWEFSTIEEGRWFDSLGNRSLALDANDRPQLAYGGRDLYHAWHDGTKWQTIMVDRGPGMGRFASIALPPGTGSTCIGYVDEAAGRVKCAQWVMISDFPVRWAWRIESVAPVATGRSVTVGANAAGQPRLLYFSPEGHVMYAYRDTAWHLETLFTNTATDTQPHADMLLDGAGRAHVVYSRTHGPVTYAWRAVDGGWTSSSCGMVHGGDAYPALALDAADRPHVVYARNLPSTPPTFLVHAHFDGSAWQQEPVWGSEELWVARDISLVMRNGALHLGYFDTDSSRLAYENLTAGTSAWVDSATNSGSLPSLAVTADGQPRISYYSQTLEALHYASLVGKTWSNTVVDQARSRAIGASIAVTPSNVVHAAWVDGLHQHLRYARKAGGEWNVSAVADGATTHTSLKLTTNGYPRITFYSAASDSLQYASLLKGTMVEYWSTETADTGGGRSSSLALDDDWPWISYVSGGNVKCARKTTNGWSTVIVDTAEWIDLGTAIAIAPNGAPAIAYGHQGRLMYAYSHWFRGLLYWDKETVATNYDLAVQPTLVFNGEGQACIGFGEDAKGARFAWRDAGGWHVQEVDGSVVCTAASYAMDDAGSHYLLCRVAGDQLRHAFGFGPLTNLTWRLASLEGSAPSASLGIGLSLRDRVPHLIFPSAGASRDVRFARGLPLRWVGISHETGGTSLQWSGETNGVELQGRASANAGRWAIVARGLTGTQYSLKGTNPAAFYRLRLE